MMKRIASIAVGFGFLVCAAIQPAKAVTFEALSGGNVVATADFTISGSTLTVILTNTSTGDVLVPTDVLTGLFFDLTGNPTLTRTSALLTAAGDNVVYDSPQPTGDVVGGEWAYKSGLVGAPDGATQGISSVGFGLFGAADRFPGSNLSGNSNGSLAGIDYGLLSAGDNSGTGNTGVTGSGGLINNSVTFVLGGLPTGFTEADISNVSFQYGSALTETNIPVIPEPEIYAMMLAGLGLMGFVARRRRQQASAA